jgi:predicted transcriptional regulator of viral defense system
MNWFGVDQEKMDADGKLQILKGYMEEKGYRERFGNGRYVVYTQ